MIEAALFGLAHVLVFVYWLGGDLGAFYTSRFLTRDGVGPEKRLMAAKIVGNVDMAPRSALILALPTGLALAEMRQWVDIGWLLVAIVAGVAALWLMLAWRLHLSHGSGATGVRRADMTLRIITLIALLVTPLLMTDWPAFIRIKMWLLAGCIVLGLAIRMVLTPLGPALAGLSGADGARCEASLKATLRRARPLVVGIWVLLVSAAFLGLWAPTQFN